MNTINKELSPDTNLSHYRIVSKIGAGGMGEVYLAQDTKLDRKVALKILPAELAANQDRMRRFVQEAKAASALNHPNIITIHEIDQTDSGYFIATEFIDGDTLRQHIRSAPMKLREVLDVAVQSASALSAAHAAGIVHRDIKPENVMLRRDGIVKVLDFGLAKLTAAESTTVDNERPTKALFKTDPGTVVGTAIYMSPEQARGMDVDARTDIFSLGVVLYEMVAGCLPFAGSSSSEVMASILSEKEPQPLARYSRDVPAELERIASKALRKNRDERYQTIKDLLIDLKDLKRQLELQAQLERSVPPELRARATTEGSEPPMGEMPPAQATQTGADATARTTSSAEYIAKGIKQRKLVAGIVVLALVVGSIGLGLYLHARNSEVAIESIAVLPFENKSADANSEYLSDGLAESLIYRLSQLPNLKVSPTSSVMRYKGKATDVKTIAGELGVSAVLTGRIAQRGDNLTISVELVDVRNNKLLWGEQYERKMSELLTTQREIATEITQNLKLKLSGEGEKALTKHYTDNNEAYQLYLKGRYHYAKRTKDDILKGIDYFQQAIKLDPSFALAYVEISDSYSSMPAYPYLSPKEAYPQAKAAAQKALVIDSSLAEAHTALAFSLAVFDWNWVEAEREFKRALELNPNLSFAHFRYGWNYLSPMGRSDEAITEIRRALELEPLSLVTNTNLAIVYTDARQNDRALAQARKTYDLEPNFVVGRWALSQAYIVNGMYADAITLNEQSLQTDPTNQVFLRFAGYAYAKSGRRHEAEEVIKRFKDIAKTQYVMSFRVAQIYVALGDKEKAFAELEKAFTERDWELHRLKVDPFMDPLRADPRFKELLKRLNLPE